MSSAVAVANGSKAIADVSDPILQDEKLWQVVASGDLKGLSPAQKSAYYLYRCRVEGLNPASQPFTYMNMQGKEILYGGKTAADQLRKLHGISIVSVEVEDDGEYIRCAVRVRDQNGREDYEEGIVFTGTSKGVQRANDRMKAISKAKRRATYSICGTGVLDETEVADIPGSPLNAVVSSGIANEARASVSLDGETLPLTAKVGQAINTATGEVTTKTANEMLAEIKTMREYLGWSSADVLSEAEKLKYDMKKIDGITAMHTWLDQAVRNEQQADEDDEEIIEGEFTLPGFGGNPDRYAEMAPE